MESHRSNARSDIATYGPFVLQAVLSERTEEWSLKPVFDLCCLVGEQKLYVTQIFFSRSTLPEILSQANHHLEERKQYYERLYRWAQTLSDTEVVQQLMQDNNATLMFNIQQQSLQEYQKEIAQAVILIHEESDIAGRTAACHQG